MDSFPRPRFKKAVVVIAAMGMIFLAGLYYQRHQASADSPPQLRKATEQILQRIDALQNPPDCSRARFLRLRSELQNRGFSAFAHLVALGLMISFNLNRTMVSDLRGYQYGNFTSLFLPLSRTCSTADTREDNTLEWELLYSHQRNNWGMSPYHLPSSVNATVRALHSNAPAWWYGVCISYILRMQPHMAKEVALAKEKLQFKSPVVGVQVRRTDKIIREAKFYPLSSYMQHVESFWNKRATRGKEDKRKVFLATDEPKVEMEALANYTDYSFLHLKIDPKAKAAKTRYSTVGVKSVLTDIFILAACDSVVCTFSSNICRMVYELRCVTRISPSVVSLDAGWHVYGIAPPKP